MQKFILDKKEFFSLMFASICFVTNVSAQDYQKYHETCYINGENVANFVGKDVFIQYEVYKQWNWVGNNEHHVTEITFDIDLEGKTFNEHISRESGDRDYDQSALEAIRKASPIRAQNPVQPHRGALFFSELCYFVKEAKMVFDSTIFDAKSPSYFLPENILRQKAKNSVKGMGLPEGLQRSLEESYLEQH